MRYDDLVAEMAALRQLAQVAALIFLCLVGCLWCVLRTLRRQAAELRTLQERVESLQAQVKDGSST
jgi:ABC-type nickel/cobalt efflux system permease component RcnA